MSTHRSFTVRVPTEIYLEVAALAQADKQHLNTKVNQLVALGLDKHVSLDAALRRMIKSSVVE